MRSITHNRHYYLVAMQPPLSGCVLFWSDAGYTANVDEAEIYTGEEATRHLGRMHALTAVEVELIADCIAKHVPILTLRNRLRRRPEA